MQYLKLILIGTLISSTVHSSEVDQFTDRYIHLADSFDIISKKAESLLDKALVKANKKKRHQCNEKRLYKSMRKYFRNHVQGKEFAQFVMHDDSIDRRPTILKESIYGDFTVIDAYTIALAKIYKDTAGSVINVGGIQIGTDKFEHFMGQGYIYFKKYYLKKSHDLKALLQYGDLTERYLLGSKTTGVYSYGDLAANFTGMRFWNHLLQKNDDILGAEYNWGPYVVCTDGKWVKNKGDHKYTIDFNKYINVGWDEANNCAKFRKPSILKKVLDRITGLEVADKNGRNYYCPINSAAILEVKEMWGPVIGPQIINVEGHSYLKKYIEK